MMTEASIGLQVEFTAWAPKVQVSIITGTYLYLYLSKFQGAFNKCVPCQHVYRTAGYKPLWDRCSVLSVRLQTPKLKSFLTAVHLYARDCFKIFDSSSHFQHGSTYSVAKGTRAFYRVCPIVMRSRYQRIVAQPLDLYKNKRPYVHNTTNAPLRHRRLIPVAGFI